NLQANMRVAFEQVFRKTFRAQKRIVQGVDDECWDLNFSYKPQGTALLVIIDRIPESVEWRRVLVVKLDKRLNMAESGSVKFVSQLRLLQYFGFQTSQKAVRVNPVHR